MKARIRYRYTIVNPADGEDVVANYYNRDAALNALVANLNRGIAYASFVGRTYQDADGHSHCVEAIPQPRGL